MTVGVSTPKRRAATEKDKPHEQCRSISYMSNHRRLRGDPGLRYPALLVEVLNDFVGWREKHSDKFWHVYQSTRV